MEERTEAIRERNYGIDLLRLLAMCAIVILHTLGQGGVLAAAPAGSGTALTARALESLTYCAVDVFALISGYVSFTCAEKKTRLSSWLLLWLETAFYGGAVALVFCFLRPDVVTPEKVRGMCLPLKNYMYWYFTAYTGLFVIKPLLNAGVRACPEKTGKRIFLAVLCAFSVYEALRPQFKLSGGYSFAWITILYLTGALMRKCRIGERLRPTAALAGIAALTALNWAWKAFAAVLPAALRESDPLSYVSPTVLGTAIFFVLLFAKVRPGKRLQGLIRFAAPGAFAVYLLNTHPNIWSLVLQDRFAFLAQKPAALMLLSVLGFALAFTAAAVCIDWLRQKLVQLLHIRQAAQAVERLAERCADWIGEKL